MNSISNTVVIADSETLMLAGVRRLLDDIPEVDVVGEAASGEALVGLVADLRPVIVISEVTLDGMNGHDAARRILARLPETYFVFLSSQTAEASVRTAMKIGASGFISKSGDASELSLAIKAVKRGQVYLSPSVSHHAFDRRRANRDDDDVILPPRQRDVLRLMGRGKSTKEIASLLGISTKTVETHRARMMQALNFSNINTLVHFAVKAMIEADLRE